MSVIDGLCYGTELFYHPVSRKVANAAASANNDERSTAPTPVKSSNCTTCCRRWDALRGLLKTSCKRYRDDAQAIDAALGDPLVTSTVFRTDAKTDLEALNRIRRQSGGEGPWDSGKVKPFVPSVVYEEANIDIVCGLCGLEANFFILPALPRDNSSQVSFMIHLLYCAMLAVLFCAGLRCAVLIGVVYRTRRLEHRLVWQPPLRRTSSSALLAVSALSANQGMVQLVWKKSSNTRKPIF